MLRLAGFFVLVMLVLQVLRHVPVVGRIFDIPFLGFWGAAILVSAGVSWLADEALRRRRLRTRLKDLRHVDTPHNQGKLGALLQSAGRNREALAPLERAVAGEPDSAEWRYRLGSALLGLRRPAEAIEPLRRAAELDEGHAYGGLLLRLAEALTRAGREEEALAVLARFDENHGESAEQAYRKGVALARLRRKSEARASFARAGELAARASAFQRKEARRWALRSWLARLT